MKKEKLNSIIPDGIVIIEDQFIQETLSKIDTNTLAKNIIEIIDGKPSRYNQVNPFKNGFVNNANKDEIRSKLENHTFTSIDTSLRITNIQNINPEIKKVQLYLYKSFKLPSSCNLYFTPSSKANCFNFHSDYQEALIYQISGSKKWTIPLDENKNPLLTVNHNEDNPYEKEDNITFDVKKNDLFSLSHSIIHKAEHQGDEASLHLTFAIQKPNEYDIANQLIQDLYSGDKIKKALSHQVESDIHSALTSVLKKLDDHDLKAFEKKTERILTQKELLLIKKGRLY